MVSFELDSPGSTSFVLLDLLCFTLAAGLEEESGPAFNRGDLVLLRPDFLVGGVGEGEGEGEGEFEGEGVGGLITLFLEVPAVSGVSGVLDCWVNPDISTEVKLIGEAEGDVG